MKGPETRISLWSIRQCVNQWDGVKTRMRFWFILKLCMGKPFTQQQNRVNVEVSEEYHSVTVLILITFFILDIINLWNSNFIFVFKFIQHLLQLIQCCLLCTGYPHRNFWVWKKENVCENWEKEAKISQGNHQEKDNLM